MSCIMNFDIDTTNQQLRESSPLDVVRWAMAQGKRVMTTTSFSPNSAAMLHLVTQVNPDAEIVWVDSGYNVPDAYRVAERLIKDLQLNLRVYTPRMTAERRNALMGGIPHPDENPALFNEFVHQVKLEPFQRALDELKPDIWITGIRRDETDFRKTLDILSWDGRGLLKVAPLFYQSEDFIVDYMAEHALPTCKHYFDPTKISEKSECGLHTAA